MKKLQSQRPSPTKSSPDIFILSHSKQKQQLNSLKTQKRQNHPQNNIYSKEKTKNLEVTTGFQVLKSPVENHGQNIDRLTDVPKQKSWRKIRKDKCLRIIFKWLTKKIEKNNIKDILTKTLTFMNQNSSENTPQYVRRNRFAKLDEKGDCIERSSKKFDQNGELAMLINEQAKEQNRIAMKQAKLTQSFQISGEKSRSRSNSQRLIGKNVYVVSKNTKIDVGRQKNTYRTVSQKVIPSSAQQLAIPKVFKSAQNIQEAIVTPLNKGNPQQRRSQILNDTPSFSMEYPNPPSFQNPITAQTKFNKNIIKCTQKLPLRTPIMTPKYSQTSSPIQRCNQKNLIVKPSVAIENYYFPVSTQPQDYKKKQLLNSKARTKSLGKISFIYDDRQSKYKTKIPGAANTAPFIADYFQAVKELPISSRACRNELSQLRKRSRSLPKITFTYSNTPKIQQQSHNINAQQANKRQSNLDMNEDTYLSRNHIVSYPRFHQKQIFIVQKKNTPYKQPAETAPLANFPQKSHPKLNIVSSPHEIKLNMLNQRPQSQAKNCQYYAINHSKPAQIPNQQSNCRKRVKSYDIFILRRPYLMKQWKAIENVNQRVRAQSQNTKLRQTQNRRQ